MFDSEKTSLPNMFLWSVADLRILAVVATRPSGFIFPELEIEDRHGRIATTKITTSWFHLRKAAGKAAMALDKCG